MNDPSPCGLICYPGQLSTHEYSQQTELTKCQSRSAREVSESLLGCQNALLIFADHSYANDELTLSEL
jgi:hypothetical protein